MGLHRRDGQDLVNFGYESITVGATAVGFTAATITPATGRPASRAVVTVETAQIRYRGDGTAPEAAEGHILNVGDVLIVEGIANVAAVKFIRTGGTSGVIKCSFDRFL